MVVQRSMGIRTLTLLLRLVLVTVSLWGWLFIWENDHFAESDLVSRCLLYNEFLLVGILFSSGRTRDAAGLVDELVAAGRKSARQTFLSLSCVLFVGFFLQDLAGETLRKPETRVFLLSYVPWLYVTLLFSNYVLPRLLSQWAFSGEREERVALAGTVEQASTIQPWLQRKAALGLHAVGVICPQGAVAGASPVPVLGTMDEVEKILRNFSITQVILLDMSLGNKVVGGLAKVCEKAAVRFLALYNLSEYFSQHTTTFEDDGVRFISLREEPLESPVNRFLKRSLDLAVAVPVVVLLLPVTTLVVWAVQQIQSPGPIFFWQVRTGMMGRTFRMLKYRTMHVNNGDENRQASKGDPRIYPAGRWLRKLSIDELPQFVNVLYGNMSVVGPRPHLSRHDELWAEAEERYPVRKFIKPGITGCAQVAGFRGEVHTETDIRQRIEADIQYLENWSLGLDCLVIGKTIVQLVLPPKAAY